MYLVVGLGNPKPKYAGNRHNVGFMAIDALAKRWSVASFREKFGGETAKVEAGRDAVLLKPMTYMNLSGESVQKALAFYKTPIERVLVIHDELDIEFKTLRLKNGGGAAGHNGLRSIIQHCGDTFLRLRVGIGRPRSGATEGYVLSDFNSMERAELPDVLDKACVAVELAIDRGVQLAMNEVNRKV